MGVGVGMGEVSGFHSRPARRSRSSTAPVLPSAHMHVNDLVKDVAVSACAIAPTPAQSGGRLCEIYLGNVLGFCPMVWLV